MTHISRIVFGHDQCTFELSRGLSLDLFPQSVSLSRGEVRQQLRVTSQVNPQHAEGSLLFVHDTVHHAITDWLIDV